MKHAGRSLKKKHKRHNKIIDLSLLPPCKKCFEFPSLTENGWATTGDIVWIEEAFPAEVEELITRDEDNGVMWYGSDVESSDDEDYDDGF